MESKKITLKPNLAVLHEHGAVFAFQPISGSQVSILFGLTDTPHGPRYYRQSERGAFGSTARAKQGLETLDQTHLDLLDDVVDESYVLLRCLEEGTEGDYWKGQIIDQRKD